MKKINEIINNSKSDFNFQDEAIKAHVHTLEAFRVISEKLFKTTEKYGPAGNEATTGGIFEALKQINEQFINNLGMVKSKLEFCDDLEAIINRAREKYENDDN